MASKFLYIFHIHTHKDIGKLFQPSTIKLTNLKVCDTYCKVFKLNI